MDVSKYIPTSTYRVQFNHLFTLHQAIELVEYWRDLGISHCYSSPLQSAKKGSLHGYDIVDPSKLNEEVGRLEDFQQFVQKLKNYNMGIILDIVPNHMYIIDKENRYWNDVLENGPSSIYSNFFDIDWNPPRKELSNKVLLPILDQQYGDFIENEGLKVIFLNGAFFIQLSSLNLPTDPKSWIPILEDISQELTKDYVEEPFFLMELKSIITALTHLPATTLRETEKKEERYREKELIKKRLSRLEEERVFATCLENYLETFKGIKGDSNSFDKLETFLNKQPYRLCFWRVANDEINFRRFFDIFEYAGLRTELTEVFKAIHSTVFEFIEKKLIDGLRIDHIDGLLDPEQYLKDLQACCKEALNKDFNSGTENSKDNFFVVAEKILTGEEKLSSYWPLDGTVGYDFLNYLNGIFIVPSSKYVIDLIYKQFTGIDFKPLELEYACKHLILQVIMPSELSILSRQLDRISQQHRNSRDFTANSLKDALSDIIACFPIYRSYLHIDQEAMEEEDKKYILLAVLKAKHLNPVLNTTIFDFIQDVLLLKHPEGLTESQKKERRNFVFRFQQLTGPVMAKGIEDTAFYRRNMLLSLNEVGGDLHRYATTLDEFHQKNIDRLKSWPNTFNATSTHDTKRSEDVRARINVLTEIPEEWGQALQQWSELNRKHKIRIAGESIPDENEEYYLYQTLAGSWPLETMSADEHQNYRDRILNHMEKAIREAKIHTSWINPNKEYEEAVQEFIKKILHPDLSQNNFLKQFLEFIPAIIHPGMLNSLSQVLLKLTCPGIPDIFQGCERWNFSLVDPDNRKPVDYTLSINQLREILSIGEHELYKYFTEIVMKPEDGRIKLFLLARALRLRNAEKELFSKGAYIPFEVHGEFQNHIIAFARAYQGKSILVATVRFTHTLLNSSKQLVIDPQKWSKTEIHLPEDFDFLEFRHCFTNEAILPVTNENKLIIKLESLFDPLPVAILEGKRPKNV